MKIILIIFFGFSSFYLISQDNSKKTLNLETGKVVSSFLYQSGTEEIPAPIQYVSGQSYGLSIDIPLGKKGCVQPFLNYYEAGAESTVGFLPVKWQLNYLGVGGNYLFTVFEKGNYSLRPGLGIGSYYMLRGQQQIGIQNYDVKQAGALKSWDIQTGLLVSNLFKISEQAGFFVNYRFDIGLNQIEKEDIGEMTRNMAHKILVGLRFNL